MKRFSVWLFIPLLAAACGEEEELLSGRYLGTQNFGIGQVSSPMLLELKESAATDQLNGTVTPAFRNITNGAPLIGLASGRSFYFESEWDQITFAYEGSENGGTIQGEYQPVGCIEPSRGPCLTDSDGTFIAQRQ